MAEIMIEFYDENDLLYELDGSVQSLLPLIPLSGRAIMVRPGGVLIGARNKASAPIGALVAQIDESTACHIESLFVLPEARRRRVATAMVETLQEYCADEHFAGIAAQWAEPQMAEFSDFFSAAGFGRGKDGNVVYEVPLTDGKEFTVPGEEHENAGITPIPMTELPLAMRARWMLRFGQDIHPTLGPKSVCGTLLKEHSYFICDDQNVRGYLLASRFDRHTVSIAALHSDPSALKSLPRLLGTGIRSLANAFPEDTLRFTIATPEASKIALRLLKQHSFPAKEIRLKTAYWNSIEW